MDFMEWFNSPAPDFMTGGSGANEWGLPESYVRQQNMSQLGNIGAALMAAGAKQPLSSRGETLANVGKAAAASPDYLNAARQFTALQTSRYDLARKKKDDESSDALMTDLFGTSEEPRISAPPIAAGRSLSQPAKPFAVQPRADARPTEAVSPAAAPTAPLPTYGSQKPQLSPVAAPAGAGGYGTLTPPGPAPVPQPGAQQPRIETVPVRPTPEPQPGPAPMPGGASLPPRANPLPAAGVEAVRGAVAPAAQAAPMPAAAPPAAPSFRERVQAMDPQSRQILQRSLQSMQPGERAQFLASQLLKPRDQGDAWVQLKTADERAAAGIDPNDDRPVQFNRKDGEVKFGNSNPNRLSTKEKIEVGKAHLDDFSKEARIPQLDKLQGDWRAVRDVYENSKSMKDGDPRKGLNDQALIYGFAKMLDQEGAVREGDYNAIAGAAGLGPSAAQWFQKAANGEALPKAVRDQIMEITTQRAVGRVAQYDQLREMYTGLAEERLGDAGIRLMQRADHIDPELRGVVARRKEAAEKQQVAVKAARQLSPADVAGIENDKLIRLVNNPDLFDLLPAATKKAITAKIGEKDGTPVPAAPGAPGGPPDIRRQPGF